MGDFQTTLDAVSVCIQARVPALVEDDPGCAKSAIISSLQRQLCDQTHTSIAALHEPPEYGGYPFPTGGSNGKPDGVSMLPLAWINRLAGAKERAGLCLDELSNAPPATRAAAMRGIHEGVWGEVEITKLSTVAIMNRPEIAESGYELSAPLANRFCHLKWHLPADYWIDQMLGGFPEPRATRLPADWRVKHLPHARALLAGFGTHKPSSLQAMPAEASRRSGPWPSYRSWTNAMTLVAASASIGETLLVGTVREGLSELDPDAAAAALTGLSPLVALLVAGCVGPDAAREFFSYASELDLPDPEAVLADPRSLVLPARGDKAYAVLASVVAAVLSQNSRERWTAAFEVLSYAHDLGKGDIAAACARSLAKDEHRPKTFDAKAVKAINKFEPMLRAAGIVRGGL